MAKMRVGEKVFVRYDGHDLWHERLLLAQVGTSKTDFIILTPDDDMYMESFSSRNTDIDGFKLVPPSGGLPRGIDPTEAYRFRNYPEGSELRRLMSDARLEAEAEEIRTGMDAGAQGTWYALETRGGVTKGSTVVLTPDDIIVGDRAIHIVSVNGEEVQLVCAQAGGGDLDEFKRSLGVDDKEEDARVLPVLSKGGMRHRPLAEAVDKMSQVRFEDWKVSGPRTVAWCLSFLVRRGGPLAHHEWWRTTAKLNLNDPGVAEHESAMRSLQDGAEYDQIDLTNLASIEHLARKAQLWEYYHRERIRTEQSTNRDKPVIDFEEQQVFLSILGAEGTLMLCPQLTEWVSKELERMSSIEKQARKAREERALRRK